MPATVHSHNPATVIPKSRPNRGHQWSTGRLNRNKGWGDEYEGQAGLAGTRARRDRRAGGALPRHAEEIRARARGILHRHALQCLGWFQSPRVLELSGFKHKARSNAPGFFVTA